MADPVVPVSTTQDQINDYVEKASASILGMVMMDIIGEITKEMQDDS